MKIVIFHGTGGSPEGNWFPWLKKELEKLGHEVYVPRMPTPEKQSVETWCEATQEQIPFWFGKDTILVGHSCGATWLCEVLSQPREEAVRASFFVSGFLDDLGNEWYDSRNHTFTHYPFDWKQARKMMGEAFVLHGDDDPYVPVAQAEKLAGKLGVKPIFIPGGGHLNAESGYMKFPELLKMIKEIVER
jgi:predicted alpha/beta hydrolase family esterase